jgi:hypothetical protein
MQDTKRAGSVESTAIFRWIVLGWKWLTIFLLPIPVAALVSFLLLWNTGPDRLMVANSSLFRVFESWGLTGLPFQFSWSFVLLDIAFYSLPYGGGVLLLHGFLCNSDDPRHRSLHFSGTLFEGVIALFLPLTVTVFLLRLILPMLPPAWSPGVGGVTSAWVLFFQQITMVLVFRVPHGVGCLFLRIVLRGIRLRQAATGHLR